MSTPKFNPQYKKLIETEAKKVGVKKITYVNKKYGYALCNKKIIQIPWPKDLLSLAYCLHEIGHIYYNEDLFKPTYYDEYKTELFVRKKFKELGLPLTQEIRDNQKEYIKKCVDISKHHSKHFKINSEVRKFIK